LLPPLPAAGGAVCPPPALALLPALPVLPALPLALLPALALAV
jgi:hypothetical protein